MREMGAVPASGLRKPQRRQVLRLAQAAQVDVDLGVDAQGTPKRSNQQGNPVKVNFAGMALCRTDPFQQGAGGTPVLSLIHI